VGLFVGFGFFYLLLRLAEVGRLTCRAREFDDVQARVGPIYRVNVAPVVHFHIVGLNRDLAVLGGALPCAPLIRLVGDRRNVIPDLLRTIRIAYIQSAHTGVEMRDEEHAIVVNRRDVLV
jgi:hypothetical protein